MHMKNVIFALFLLFVGCSDYQEMEDVTVGKTVVPHISQHVAGLIEEARYGDGKAYLELADCYREGEEVEKDFMNTILMVALAERYNGIDNIDSYFINLPQSNDYRSIYDLFNKPYYYRENQVDSIFNIAKDLKTSDLQALHGVLHILHGDTVRGFDKIEQAVGNGSSLGMLMSCFTDIKLMTVSTEKLMAVAERFPFAYSLLGDIYSGAKVSEEIIDRKRAAEYFLKADKFGLLGKRRALWLYSYLKDNNEIKISEQELQRIRTLAMIDSEN